MAQPLGQALVSGCIGPYGHDAMAVEVWHPDGYTLIPWVDFGSLSKSHSCDLDGVRVAGGRIHGAGPSYDTLVRHAKAHGLRPVDLGLGAALWTGSAPAPVV
ncbi:hypothetical protein [Streptomyces sp. NPDC037389]|uniref:hypothetical protein n=1 Tax=Streptomyces sp. NPDC037389 TaxID=3155369 RepID=UPI0033C1BDFE